MRFCGPPFRSSHGGEEGVGEHGKDDVPVPARVSTDLLLIQPALVSRALETGFDGPAASRNLDRLADQGAGGSMGQVVGDLLNAETDVTSWPPNGFSSFKYICFELELCRKIPGSGYSQGHSKTSQAHPCSHSFAASATP